MCVNNYEAFRYGCSYITFQPQPAVDYPTVHLPPPESGGSTGWQQPPCLPTRGDWPAREAHGLGM